MFATTLAGSVERAFLEMDLPEKPLIDHEELVLNVFCTSHSSRSKPLHCYSAETAVSSLQGNRQAFFSLKKKQVKGSTGRVALLLDGCYDWASVP